MNIGVQIYFLVSISPKRKNRFSRKSRKLILFLNFYFIFKLYNIVLVLPNIEMNPPHVYMFQTKTEVGLKVRYGIING